MEENEIYEVLGVTPSGIEAAAPDSPGTPQEGGALEASDHLSNSSLEVMVSPVKLFFSPARAKKSFQAPLACSRSLASAASTARLISACRDAAGPGCGGQSRCEAG